MPNVKQDSDTTKNCEIHYRHNVERHMTKCTLMHLKRLYMSNSMNDGMFDRRVQDSDFIFDGSLFSPDVSQYKLYTSIRDMKAQYCFMGLGIGKNFEPALNRFYYLRNYGLRQTAGRFQMNQEINGDWCLALRMKLSSGALSELVSTKTLVANYLYRYERFPNGGRLLLCFERESFSGVAGGIIEGRSGESIVWQGDPTSDDQNSAESTEQGESQTIRISDEQVEYMLQVPTGKLSHQPGQSSVASISRC